VSDVSYAGAPGVTGTGPLVTQVYRNVPCTAQQGGGTIAPLAVIDVGQAGPALLFWQASTWTTAAPTGEKALPLINSQGQAALETACFFNQSSMHLPLVRRRALTESLIQGESLVSAVSSGVTDLNDSITMALIDLSDMSAPPQVRLSQLGTATGVSGQYTSQPFSCGGGLLVVSVGATAWTQNADTMTGAVLYLDGEPVAYPQLYANWAALHLPLVGADLVLQVPAGGHTLDLMAMTGTMVDSNDVWSLHVMELQGGTLAQALQIVNQCPAQNGGGVVASVPYYASGSGTQLICAQLSGFATTKDTMLQAQVLVDGVAYGGMQLFANAAELHLPLCGGDVSPGQLPQGQHTIEIVAGSALVTDGNDRVSLTVLEVAP